MVGRPLRWPQWRGTECALLSAPITADATATSKPQPHRPNHRARFAILKRAVEIMIVRNVPDVHPHIHAHPPHFRRVAHERVEQHHGLALNRHRPAWVQTDLAEDRKSVV